MKRRHGIWIIGAKGGVATTAIVGATAIARGLSSTGGMVSMNLDLDGLPLPDLDQLVFGGHDVRAESLGASAQQIRIDTGTLSSELLDAIAPDLETIDGRLRPGILVSSGSAIEAIADVDCPRRPAESFDTICSDLRRFRDENALESVIVINLASTEPTFASHDRDASETGLREAIAADSTEVIASTIYAMAAAECECGYVNFTPSHGALLPGICEAFERRGLPFMGSDGKTGETLMKSVLAPMFRQRNLRVLSWQGYNILGDRDGEVLSHGENKQSKVQSKDRLLHDYLGYPLHSHVGIDYVPSLGDWKTAWDFVHFAGFLDVKMSMQFVWQGCDAVLAAPLVLDLCRFATRSVVAGEAGPMRHLASFFKAPHDCPAEGFGQQFARLEAYVREHKSSEA